MLKRITSILLAVSVMFSLIFTVGTSASDDGTAEISNQYIKVTVSEKNGGYVISTVEGDILKKSDDNAALTHRGENFDTSFTSFKIGSDEYVFGNKYGFLGMGASTVETEVNEAEGSIISTWTLRSLCTRWGLKRRGRRMRATG